MTKFIRSVKVPLLLLIVMLILEVLSRANILPASDQWSLMIKSAVVKYGLLIIGPLAFLENLASFNVYFPGSIVILTTMALSAGDPGRAVRIFCIYYVCAISAYHVDYSIGLALRAKIGSVAGTSLFDRTAHLPLWIRFAVFFVHPQLASILSVQIGSEGRSYKEIIIYYFSFPSSTQHYINTIYDINL